MFVSRTRPFRLARPAFVRVATCRTLVTEWPDGGLLARARTNNRATKLKGTGMVGCSACKNMRWKVNQIHHRHQVHTKLTREGALTKTRDT
jgi:hypothetical protein